MSPVSMFFLLGCDFGSDSGDQTVVDTGEGAHFIEEDCGDERNGVLVYGLTGEVDTPLLEALGFELTIWDADQWLAASTDDFSKFDFIVVGEQGCMGPESGELDVLTETGGVWGPAVDGRVVVSGLDVACHTVDWESFKGGDETVPPRLYENTMRWLSGGCGTGAYFATDWGRQDGAHLAPMGTWDEYPTRGNIVTILEPEHPLFSGIEGDGLNQWGASYHTVFTTWPNDFIPLVEAQSALHHRHPVSWGGMVMVVRNSL